MTFGGNTPRTDILASNLDQTKTVQIQVKTKRTGDWHTRSTVGKPREQIKASQVRDRFWGFVDLGGAQPRYWIVPERWMLIHLYDSYQAYLRKHGGQRARSPESTHQGITEKDIRRWAKGNGWDRLGILP